MKATQTERVIAAARSYRGVSQVDFLGPDTADGGPPITRLAARLWDAEQKGYSFECVGWRDRCKAWRLISEPEVERGGGVEGPALSDAGSPSRQATPSLSTGPSPHRLFQIGVPVSGHYDDVDQDAA